MRASDSDRGLICPASLVLPKSGERSVNANKAAAWGTTVHSWKENGVTNGNKTLNKKLAATGIDRARLWPEVGDSYGHETTFSIHLETLQVRIWTPEGSKYSRDDWKRRHPKRNYLTGSIDWLSTISRKGTKELPWVDDLKTGAWPVYAKKSKQLRSYALVPWILHGCTTDVWGSITQWPKYRIDGKPKRNWCLYTSKDLLAHLQRIRWANKNTQLAVYSEEGCRFCMCKDSCDEYQLQVN